MHLITALDVLDQTSLDHVVDVASGAADAIQVRAKGATDRELVTWSSALVDAVRPAGIVVILNDRLDLAVAAGADGVHLGADDLPIDLARGMAPQGFLVGGTCRNAQQARAARDQGADYVGLGPIHHTTTKSGLPDPLGLSVLTEVSTVLPTVAIGGVTAARVPGVMAAGAYGVAVISAVWQSEDPPRAAKEIAALVGAS